MIEGRIVRIFDDERMVINVGSDEGIETDMELAVFTPEEPIRDPENDEELGSYRRKKAIIIASEVFPRFTIAVAPRRRVRVEEPRPQRDPLRNESSSALSDLLTGRNRPKYRSVPGKLNIDSSQADPMPTGNRLRLGDHVEAELPEPPPSPQATDASETSASEG